MLSAIETIAGISLLPHSNELLAIYQNPLSAGSGKPSALQSTNQLQAENVEKLSAVNVIGLSAISSQQEPHRYG
jgi:hypothetical protein